NLAESTPGTAVNVVTPLAAPTTLAATSPTATSVHLTWANVSAAATNVAIERSDGAGITWGTPVTVAASATDWTDSTVAEGTAYTYRIHATKTGNSSVQALTAAASVTTLPAAPTTLTATEFSATTIDLAWVDQSGHETGYVVERSEDGGAYAAIGGTLAAGTTSYSDATAHEGGMFAYLVHAVGTGGSSTTASAGITTTPAAPTGVAATALTATRVDLGWTDASNGETGYVLERSTDNSNWSALTTLAPGATTYTDTVGEASTHYYRVKAVRDAAASAWATTAAATTVPAAPTTLAASVPPGAPKVNLTWADNSGGETGYEVERSADAGANWVLVTTTAANATAYADASVVEGMMYKFRVRATSSAGASDWSATADASTLPEAPTALAVTAATSGSVSLSWADNSTHEAGYRVERSIGGTTWATVANPAADATTFTDPTAAEGTTYQYRVRAVTPGVVGTPSLTVSAATPLQAPSGFAATVASPTRVNLSWADNSALESNYKVERSTDGGSTFAPLATVPMNGTSYADAAASPGATYVYRVRATKASGTVLSDWATSTAQTTPPTDPTGVTATPVAANQVTVTWADAAGETAYTVERSGDNGTTWSVRATNVAANATSYADTGTVENHEYLYRVKATNGALASAYAAAAAVTTLPATPTGLAAITEASDTINLSWVDQSAVETGYKVERRVQGAPDNTWAEIVVLPAGSTSYADVTGDESTAYEYRVRATTGGRNSAYSFSGMATTLPVAVTGLTLVGTTATTAQLSWTNPTAAPTLVVERSDDGGNTFAAVHQVGQHATGYTDTGLTTGASYVYRVRAYNGDAGFSDPSNTVVVVPA
ncbi:MAG: repeat-containing protein, partial [Phycisphaerales bacterium]|nr:repeat-containing protein [Phycisphaerales bacterium]